MRSAKSLLLASAALLSSAAALPLHAQTNRFDVVQAAQPDKEKEQKQRPQQHQAPPAKQPAAPPQAQPPHPAPPAQPPRPAAPPPQAPHPAPPPVAQPPRPTAPPPEQRRPVPPPVEQRRPVPPPSTIEQHRPPQSAPQVQQPHVPPPQPAPQQNQTPQRAPAAPSPQSQTAPPSPSTAPSGLQPPHRQPPDIRPAQQTPPQTAPIVAPTAPPPQPRDTNQFIRQPGQQAPAPTIQDLRRERQQTREGNATIIREGDRTLVREGQSTIIRHSESDRFAVGARDVRVEQRGNETHSIIERPNGDRIITITDERGRLLRRVRREPNGREIVIIDQSGIPRRDTYFVVVPPPRYTLPPDRYYVDIDRAPLERIYDTLISAPFEPIEQVYTIDEVRYSPGLRMMLPRVDLDINFETGSWQITPDQMGKLDVIARALNRAIDRNPREVFLIEGHTDAVGADDDNLSLSDRRAESVAVALTQEFGVPPENLITQGYGEQELKVPTMGPSRENRRVAVRRITPLIDRMAAR